MFKSNYSIKGKYIYSHSHNGFISGYLMIENDFIRHIIIDNQQNQTYIEQKLKEYTLIYDFKNLFVTPGGIDLNISLNVLHQEQEFNKLEFISSLCSLGGITTVINQPTTVLKQEYAQMSQELIVQLQLQELKERCYVDYGQLSILNQNTQKDVMKILKQKAIGFKIFLSPQSDSLYFKDYFSLRNSIEQINKLDTQTTLFIHTQVNQYYFLLSKSMQDKDLFQTSPLRLTQFQQRLNIEMKLKNEGSDGIKGNVESDDEIFKQQEIPEWKSYLNVFNILTDKMQLNQDQYYQLCKENTYKAQYRLLSRAEQLSYMKKNDADFHKFVYRQSLQSNEKFTRQSVEMQQEFIQQKSGLFEQFLKFSNSNCKIENIQLAKDPDQFKDYDSSIKLQSQKKKEAKGPQKQEIKSINTIYSKNMEEDEVKGDSDDDSELQLNFEFKPQSSSQLKSKQSQEIEQQPQKLSLSPQKNSIKGLNLNSKLLDRRQQMSKQGFKPLQLNSKIQKIKEQQEIYVSNQSFDQLSSEEQEADPSQETQYFQDYLYFLTFRPAVWEDIAVGQVAKSLGVPTLRKKKKIKSVGSKLDIKKLNFIFTNMSDAFTIALIQRFKEHQYSIYTDISYPHLYYDEKYFKINDIRFKNDPPIRQKLNKKLLNYAFKQSNMIDTISSGHQFVSKIYKQTTGNNDFRRAVNGLNCVGLNLPILWTLEIINIKQEYNLNSTQIKEFYYQKDNLDVFNEIENAVKRLVLRMCVNPSKAVNIDMKKGMIKEGFLADFVVWNPFESFNFDFESLIQQSNLREPEYLGQEHIFNKKNFYGSVIMTIMRGKRCYERKDVIDEDNKLKHLYVFHRINGQNVA